PGQARSHLARRSLPEPAMQSLEAQGETVTWRRAGVGPELAAPPILYASVDGIGYAALGPMTRVAEGWRRSGVPMPGGHSYLRAEGRVAGGGNDGSQGLVESVRQVWRDDRIFRDGFD